MGVWLELGYMVVCVDLKVHEVMRYVNTNAQCTDGCCEVCVWQDEVVVCSCVRSRAS